MKATQLKNLLILWNSQGLFQGDLNRVQQFSLSWVIANEQGAKLDLLKIQTLASNADVYKAIFEEGGPQRLDDSEAEWMPLNPEEEKTILEEIERWQSQRESV